MSNGVLTVGPITIATLPAELKGWLGKGVDLFQCEPLKPPSTKPARLLSSSLPDDFREIQPLPATNYQEVYADSLLDIAHKLTVEAGLKGNYGGVSGGVSSKFGLTEKRTEKRHLQQIFFGASAASYNITRNKVALKQLLDGNFKEALAGWDVDELFNTYGTHLIIKMIVGGRAEYFCQSSDLSSISERDFKIAAKAKYEAAGGSIEGSASVGTVDSQKQQLVSGSLGITTTGGSSVAAVNIKEGGWAAWVKSIGAEPGFLGFDKDNGLLPIWELAADDARKNLIHEAYKRRAAKAFRTEILSWTSDDKPHPDARVTVPEGYKLLSGGALDNFKGAGNLLTASFPENNNTWRASGKDHGPDGNSPDPASITAFAVALYDPDDLGPVIN